MTASQMATVVIRAAIRVPHKAAAKRSHHAAEELLATLEARRMRGRLDAWEDMVDTAPDEYGVDGLWEGEL